MVPKRFLILAGATLVGLGASSAGQGAQGGRNGKGAGPTYRRVTQPLRPVTLNLETGTIVRGPTVQASNHTTCVTIDNSDHSGFVGVDSGPGSPNGPCEWIDTANKSLGSCAGGGSGLLAGFSFAYCSAALDPSLGGPGGAVCIGFREGYLPGTAANQAGPSGTVVGTFSLTGLPANTSCSSFFGGFACFLITISLGNAPIAFGGDGIGPEPNVSWSWQFKDLGTDGALAKTFPFLSCVFSCTGPTRPPPAYDCWGMQDGLERYCPPGTLLSSFTFGSINQTGQGPGFTSLAMTIQEACLLTSATTTTTAAPNNQGKTATLVEDSPVALGLPARFTLGCQQASVRKKPTIFRLGFGPIRPPLHSKWGDILVPIDGQGVTAILGFHGAGNVPLQVPPAPLNFGLAGAPFGLQGFCGDDPLGFTSQGLGGSVQILALQ